MGNIRLLDRSLEEKLPVIAPPPAAIFARAQASWRGQSPVPVSYVVHVHVVEGGQPKDAHYHAGLRGGTMLVDPVSDEEKQRPPRPKGMDVHVRVGMTFRLGRADDTADYLGVPRLSPFYTFGITTASVDDYHIDRIPDGSPRSTYHLSLRPAHLSYELRLRDLWVDARTMQFVAAQTYGNFTTWPYVMAHWRVDFVRTPFGTAIGCEATDEPLRVDGHLYTGVRVCFETLRADPIAGAFADVHLFQAKRTLEEPRW